MLSYLATFLITMATIFSYGTPENYANWIAYPLDVGEFYAEIGLINPISGEKIMIEVGGIEPESLIWSPDRRFLFFYQNGNIYKLEVSSKEKHAISSSGKSAYFTVSHNGSHITYIEYPDRIVVSDYDGNEIMGKSFPDLIITPLHFSHDNKYVIYQSSNPDQITLNSIHIVTGTVEPISIQNHQAIENSILFNTQSTDVENHQLLLVSSFPFKAFDIGQTDLFEYSANFVLEDEFALYYGHGENPEMPNGLWLQNIETKDSTLVLSDPLYGFDISPGRESVAYIIQNEQSVDLCVLNLYTLQSGCLTDDVFNYGKPSWAG